jgi:uncharacterized protein (TIGR03435 family)
VRAFYATALLYLTLTAASAQTASQSPPTSQPAFEVASIHTVAPYSEDEIRRGLGDFPWSAFPTSRFFAHRLTLKMLIGLAYGVEQKYIQGGPDWLDSQAYDIEAKVEGEHQLTYEQIKPLLQHLIEQRLKVATHRVTKMFPGYALIVAKGGEKLQSAKADTRPHANIFSNRLQAQHMDLDHFVEILSHPVGYPVVDKTGITRNFDIDLGFAPANDPSSPLPSLFTALQEQLGLKLESQRVPVEMLVIDHADKIPTEN